MDKQTLEQYLEIVRSFDDAMLVTQRGSDLRSRPMKIADVSDDGSIWFLTDIDSGKLDETTEEPFVNLSLQGGGRYLSVSGSAVVSRERSKVDELWSTAYEIWFPEGKNDPAVAVLHVVPTYSEYWDNSGAKGFKALYEMGRAMLSDEQPAFDEDVHRKVDFPDSPTVADR